MDASPSVEAWFKLISVPRRLVVLTESDFVTYKGVTVLIVFFQATNVQFFYFNLFCVGLNIFRIKLFNILIIIILRFCYIFFQLHRHYFLQQVFSTQFFCEIDNVRLMHCNLPRSNYSLTRKPGSVFRKSSHPLIFPVFMNSTQFFIILSEKFFSSSVKTTP